MDWTSLAPSVRVIGEPPDVLGLTHDSRQVRPGWAFIAVPGRVSDGHDFIEAALRAGAALTVVQADHEAKWRRFVGLTPIVVVDDCRSAMGPAAAAVHGRPTRSLRLIGVTGTDGKTTTTHLIAHVLDRAGLGCGLLSSVGFDTGRGMALNTSHMTTLEATTIQSLLAAAVEGGRRSMVVEASSEGLAQHRLDGCEFDAAVFTNLTRDHLDFHGTMEAYLAAKGRLFEMLDETDGKPFPKAAVLNSDDPASAFLRGRTRAPVLTYAMDSEADFRATHVRPEGAAHSFTLRAEEKELAARVPLVGQFNVYNCLAAIAVARSQGVPLTDALAALASFPGVPGRMEAIDCGQPFAVVVDIASTPAALESVLGALRPATEGRIWAVFGAAGGRDPARRNGMGRVAGRFADRVVLTNEDPRDEDPDSIIEAIAAGLREARRREGRDFVRVPDRREAIRYAFQRAEAGDTVLLAGKATETTMVFGREERPWDERATARELLAGG